jgi:hypothetical protein
MGSFDAKKTQSKISCLGTFKARRPDHPDLNADQAVMETEFCFQILPALNHCARATPLKLKHCFSSASKIYIEPKPFFTLKNFLKSVTSIGETKWRFRKILPHSAQRRVFAKLGKGFFVSTHCGRRLCFGRMTRRR